MSVQTQRPTTSFHNMTVTGAGGDADAALSDNNPATFVQPDNKGDILILGFSTYTPPAGSKFISALLRIAYQSFDSSSFYNQKVCGVPASSYAAQAGGFTVWTAGVTLLTTGPTDWSTQLQLTWPTLAPQLAEVYLDLVYATQPVASVTTPANDPSHVAPLTTTNRPNVTWSATTDSGGGPLTNYEVKLYNDVTTNPDVDTPLDTSGIQNGAGSSWRGTVRLANGNFRAYVRVAQTINGVTHWSAWTFNTFSISVSLPAAPTFSVAGDNANARINFTLSANSGTVTTDRIEVQRSYDGGVTWLAQRTLRSDDQLTAYTNVRDYEAPNGVTASYRARAVHDFGGGESSVSAFTSTVTASWTSTGYWLKHPTNPALSKTVELVSPASGGVTGAARQAVFQPLGSATAVVVSDLPQADSGTMQLRERDQATKDALDLLLEPGVPLLFQPPPSIGEPQRWLAVGDRTRTRVVDNQNKPVTTDEFGWIEVTSPEGSMVSF